MYMVAYLAMKTLVVDEDKEPSMEHIYIASILVDPLKKTFYLQSADVSGVKPEKSLR